MTNKYDVSFILGNVTTFRTVFTETEQDAVAQVLEDNPDAEELCAQLLFEGDVKNWRKQEIGQISYGIDGSDQYFLITNREDDLDVELTRHVFLSSYYYDCAYPGGYFCRNVNVYPTEHSNEMILVVQHRYDV